MGQIDATWQVGLTANVSRTMHTLALENARLARMHMHARMMDTTLSRFEDDENTLTSWCLADCLVPNQYMQHQPLQ